MDISPEFLIDFSVSCYRVLLEILDPLALQARPALASTCRPLLAWVGERKALTPCSICGQTRQLAT